MKIQCVAMCNCVRDFWGRTGQQWSVWTASFVCTAPMIIISPCSYVVFAHVAYSLAYTAHTLVDRLLEGRLLRCYYLWLPKMANGTMSSGCARERRLPMSWHIEDWHWHTVWSSHPEKPNNSRLLRSRFWQVIGIMISPSVLSHCVIYIPILSGFTWSKLCTHSAYSALYVVLYNNHHHHHHGAKRSAVASRRCDLPPKRLINNTK